MLYKSNINKKLTSILVDTQVMLSLIIGVSYSSPVRRKENYHLRLS